MTAPSPHRDRATPQPADRPLTARERQELACRLRLADSRVQRWLWAFGSAVPGLGLLVLLRHGISRRTALPALFGVSTVATAAFAFLTVVASLRGPAEQAPPDRGAPWALILGGMASFAIGHRLGQDRAAQDAVKWLELDR